MQPVTVPQNDKDNKSNARNNKKSDPKASKKQQAGNRRSPVTNNHKSDQNIPLPVAHKSLPDSTFNPSLNCNNTNTDSIKTAKGSREINNLNTVTNNGSTDVQVSRVENTRGKRRKLNPASKAQLKAEIDEPRVSKRVRLQYQPFQSPESMVITPTYYRSTPPSKTPDDKIVVFNRGDFLAVRNESGSFYVCRTAQNVYKTSKKFKIQWLSDDKEPSIYTPDFYDQTDFECVLTNLRMIRCDKGKYKLPGEEKQRVLNILTRALDVERGVSEIPDPRQVAMDGVDVSIVGKAEEEELTKISPKIEMKSEVVKHKTVGRPKKNKEKSTENAVSANNVKAAKPQKRSSRNSISRTSSSESSSSTRRTTRSSSTPAKSSPTVKANLKSNIKRAGIDSVVKKLRSKARTGTQAKAALEKVAVKTPKSIRKKKKLSPNRKPSLALNEIRRQKSVKPLQPKPKVTNYERDPMFEAVYADMPFISTLVESRLLIRAVSLGDYDLIERLLKDERMCSLGVTRSLVVRRDALSYAIERQDVKAMKMLMDSKSGEKLSPFPDLITIGDSTTSTTSSVFNFSSKNNVIRGRKEITNALLKDIDIDYMSQRQKTSFTVDVIKEALQFGVTKDTIQKMIAINPIKSEATHALVLNNIVTALHYGHRKLAGSLVDMAIIKGGVGFNSLHKEALMKDKEPFSAFRPSSIRRKTHLNARVTPIHCAALNPNPYYLKTLLQSHPDYNLQDNDGWQPIHYAAVCEGTGPLEYLISKGISTLQTDKDGNTPLHLACLTGATHNVELILSHEAKLCSDEHGISCIEKQSKNGLTPLHIAVERGNIEVVRILLQSGADAEKTTAATNDRLTPLMIAAQFGHIQIVKMLVEKGVDVETTDKKHRTALLHAIMNGCSTVVSYLLRLGANPDAVDNLGNTGMHYAAAYGWYYCYKLLEEAKAKINESNDGKVTPLLAAFLKGHMGLVDLIVQNGVDINSHFKDMNGVTLLMQTVMSKPGDLLLARLKFLVQSQSVDCKKVDVDGNNAVQKVQKTSLYEAARILIEHGCNPKALNKQGESAFSLAAKHGCFSLMKKFLETGCRLNLTFNEDKNTVLHLIVKHILQDGASEFLKMLCKDDTSIGVLKEMAKSYNSNGKTPLLLSLERYKCLLSEDETERKKFIDFIRYLIEILESDVQASTETEECEKETCLHIAAKHCTADVLSMLVSKTTNIDILNGTQKTPLVEAIISRNVEAAKFLIHAGANIKFRSVNDGNKTVLLIAAASHLTSFIPLVASKGVDVKEVDIDSGNTALHYLVDSPNGESILEAVKSLVANGADVNAVNKDGSTPLHLLVNARTGETDTIYDVEEFLIESGASLSIRDKIGRIPLHYAFVKTNNHTDTSFLDPIELVTLLTSNKDYTTMNTPDQFLDTPLHRAAMRGATISCMHLIQGVTNMDALDHKGNSPLGLSVMHGHESCALMLVQKGANFSLPLNPMLTMRTTEEANNSTDEKSETSNSDNSSVIQSCTILQEVIKKDWQGMLYLMLDQLVNLGRGVHSAIEAAIYAQRLKLAFKLTKRLKSSKSVANEKLLQILSEYIPNEAEKHLHTVLVNLLQSKNVDVNV
ncbi:Poly(ADP-ribose) polymerase pme-5-like protein [Leptotrombidium deliense]|uniref:Poly(ADP-ribose) polymerase pme-5-like protein n=1 Tax=Leptotrombidium deliense TaxID=299467 RepID=A0A443SFB0_9ACAR|nr:Poly(ADP-ribose) polymerase pme-5-like protein [Leptotrombidium deliense]